MPQKPFIMRVHFYLPAGEGLKSLGSAAHHVEYMGNRDKHELLVDAPLEKVKEEGERTTLESAAIHAKYAGEREGSLGYFGSKADDPQGAQKSILKAQGPVWRVIASVGEEDAIAMGGGLLTKAGWEAASQPVVDKMAKELGLDPQKIQWIAAVHRHQKTETNPHVHLLLWEEGEPSRKTAKWSDEERRKVRREWISSLYAPERESIGKEKMAARQEARAQLESQLKALKESGNHTQGFQRELAQKLTELGQHLPQQGRLAYAYMPKEIKQEVDTLIQWLWEQDPGLKAAHDRFLQQAEAMGTFYWHQDPVKTQNSPQRAEALARIRTNAEADLLKRLAGTALKAARYQVRPHHPPHSSHRSALNLSSALHRLIRDAEHDAARTAYWLAESQYQRRRAEQAIAYSTGVELSL